MKSIFFYQKIKYSFLPQFFFLFITQYFYMIRCIIILIFHQMSNNEMGQQQPVSIQDAIQIVTNQIVINVINDYTSYPEKHKLFNNIVETKHDIHRVFRQKIFVNSVMEGKEGSYQQPKMQKRLQKSFQKVQQKQLTQHAQQFVKNIRIQKKQLQGKFYLIRRNQLQRSRQLQKQKKLEQLMQKQMQKKIRKIKAEKNIQFFNRKKLISLRNSQVSGQPKKNVVNQFTQDQEERLKNSQIYQLDLEQIKEEQNQGIPKGVQQSSAFMRKSHLRSKTQANNRQQSIIEGVRKSRRYENSDNEDDLERSYGKKQKNQNLYHNNSNREGSQNVSFQLISMDQNLKRQSSLRASQKSRTSSKIASKNIDPSQKKVYHMKRIHTEDVSSYLQQNPIRSSQYYMGKQIEDESSEQNQGEESVRIRTNTYTEEGTYKSDRYNIHKSITGENKSYSISPVKLPIISYKNRNIHAKRFRTMSHVD